MRYPDISKPFILQTDASNVGLRAVLTQLDEKQKEHPVAYASRSLSKAEKNYLVIEKECLAVVWAVEYFRSYLLEISFEI